jgi:anti-sigma regulatory factor (Ser/Thr protein kinase)
VATSTRSWRFPATPQYIAHARYVVSAHARWLGADAGAVELAVSEAFTNAVVHASPDAAHPGDVEVIVSRHPGALEICVCDDGPCTEHVNGHAADADLGLKMIEQLTTSIELTRRGERGTQLRMSFPVR